MSFNRRIILAMDKMVAVLEQIPGAVCSVKVVAHGAIEVWVKRELFDCVATGHEVSTYDDSSKSVIVDGVRYRCL